MLSFVFLVMVCSLCYIITNKYTQKETCKIISEMNASKENVLKEIHHETDLTLKMIHKIKNRKEERD